MKPKTFATLAVVTAVAVVAAVVASTREAGVRPVARIGEAAFPGLLARVNDVARLRIEHAGGRITIERGQDGWAVAESDGYPARAVKVKRAILGLAELRLAEPKTAKPAKHAKLELRDLDAEGAKAKRVTLFAADGKEMADLLVGRRRVRMPGTTRGGVYVRWPGEAQTWLAAGDADITDEKRAWLERKIVDVVPERIRRAVIRHPGGETVTVSKAAPAGGDFTLDDIPAGKTLISKAGPTTVGRALANLLLDDARRDHAPFDAAAAAHTTFTTFDGLTVETRVAKLSDGQHWLRVTARADGAEAAGEAKEIAERTRAWTYRIPAYAASNLAKRLEHLVEDAKKPGS